MSTRDFQYDTGGLTDMVVVLYLSGGTTMVNASDGTLITANAANLANAAIATSDAVRAGQYRYTIPAMPAGLYDEVFYRKRTNGTTLVQTDTVTPYGPEGIGQFGWDGADVIGSNDLTTQLNLITLNTTSAKDDAHAIYLKLPTSGLIAGADDLTAILTAVNNINNLSALANIFGPAVLEIPDAGTTQFPFTLVVRDTEGHLLDLDATPTITATNAAGTDRSSNLSAAAHPSTGVYTFTYGAAFDAAKEGLRIVGTGAVGSSARRAEINVAVMDFDSVTAIDTIKSNVNTILTDYFRRTDPLASLGSQAKTDVTNSVPTASATATASAAAVLLNPAWKIKTNAQNQVESSNVADATINLTITPLQTTVAAPLYATRNVTMAQGSAPSVLFVVTDGDDDPVDLSGKTIRFVAAGVLGEDPTNGMFQYESPAEITIGGADNNNVTIDFDQADTGTAAKLLYYLWNVTDNQLLVKGTLTIEPARMTV